MRKETRFVCANVHSDTDELEVVVEVTEHLSEFEEKVSLVSTWVSPHNFLNGIVFEQNKN